MRFQNDFVGQCNYPIKLSLFADPRIRGRHDENFDEDEERGFPVCYFHALEHDARGEICKPHINYVLEPNSHEKEWKEENGI